MGMAALSASLLIVLPSLKIQTCWPGTGHLSWAENSDFLVGLSKQLAILISLVPTPQFLLRSMWGCGLEFHSCSKQRASFWASLVDLPQNLLFLAAQLSPGLFLFPLFPWLISMALPLALHLQRSSLNCVCCRCGARKGWCQGCHFLVGKAAAWMLALCSLVSAHWPLFAFPTISLLPD